MPANCTDVTQTPYAAKGDGATDSTTALQAAIDSGASCILVPSVFNGAEAVYLTGRLILHSGQTLTGGGTLRKTGGDANLIATDDGVSDVVIQSSAAETYPFTFDGNELIGDTAGVVEVDNAKNRVTVADLAIKNFTNRSIGIMVGNSTGVTITGNSIDGANRGTHGIEVWGGDSAANSPGALGASDITIKGNVVQNVAEGGIWGSSVRNFVIDNNTVATCGDVCIDQEGGTTGSMSNNTVWNAANGAITTFYVSSNIAIKRNVVFQAANGTSPPGLGPQSAGFVGYGQGTSTGLTIDANLFTMASNSAVNIPGDTVSGSTLSNNSIFMGPGNGSQPIFVDAASEVAESNNVVVKSQLTPPTITSLAPSKGCPGSTVTIGGTNFTDATDVRFNGVSARFTVDSPSSISAAVPSGATTGAVVVITSNGAAISPISSTVFTVR